MTDEQPHETHQPSDSDSTEDEKSTVLELFGIEVKVSNPRLAEILTMDAAEALATDIKRPGDGETVRRQRAELTEAVPDAVVSAGTPREEHETHERIELRRRVDAVGGALGFDVGADSVWSSPTGLLISVRTVPGSISFAAASDVVHKLETHRKTLSGATEGALFVVETQDAVDVFKVAIRQGRFYGHIRVISAENLERVRGLFGDGVLDHQRVVSLLLPIADIDVGELLPIRAEVSRAED